MVRILKAVDIGILADLKLAKSEELSSQEDINIIKIKSLKIFKLKTWDFYRSSNPTSNSNCLT